MKKYNKILEAVNKGIKLALDDFEDNKLVGQLTLTIKDTHYTKEIVALLNYTVDLGLPSKTLWCKYNLGCNFESLNKEPELLDPIDWYGDYYGWAEIEPYSKVDYSWDNYTYGDKWDLTKYNEFDLLTRIKPEDDAATLYMHLYNYKFYIPTKNQLDELLKYTTNEWVENYKINRIEIKGLNGREFTSKINGNKLFIPASGEYIDRVIQNGERGYIWSSDCDDIYREAAWRIGFNNSNIGVGTKKRSSNYNIRPVIKL